MKITKPNITEGNWFVAPKSRPPKYTVCEVSGYNYVGANGGKNVDETPDADAKAISAVPDMIDALIDMCSVYKELVDSGDCGHWDATDISEYENSINALIKAGCTYE